MIASVLCVVLGLSAMSPGPDPAMWDGQEKPMMKVDTPAAVVKMVQPYYPELAKKAGIEGTVRVQALVNTAGIPEKVEILTTDNEVFNESALLTVKQWRFKAAVVNGKPVAVWVTIPVRYKLQTEKKE